MCSSTLAPYRRAVRCEYTTPTRARDSVLRRYFSLRQHQSYVCATGSIQRLSMTFPLNFANHGRMPLAIPSATNERSSGASCTESFQRYGASSPTLKMPPTGLEPIAARYSFAYLPLIHIG